MLSLYGYRIDITGRYDDQTGVVVAAFQRHFRPRRVDGLADRSTVDTLRRLLTGAAFGARPDAPSVSMAARTACG